ncbi:MAG: hypothetical protein H7Z16_15940 [Pyrinomonadaceae bacterium]|nr:hypothetical protein [Pyrinomonadaceae bacterium]
MSALTLFFCVRAADAQRWVVRDFMKKRTPQEKKELSYERDRRNVYGEAPHAARKSIPLRKALRNRANRHTQNQQVKYQGPTPNQELADELQSLIHHRAPKEWGKYPDAPLREVVARKSTYRAGMRQHGGRRALRTIRTPRPEE